MNDQKRWATTRRIANLREGRNDWYKIVNSADPAVPAQVSIYDEIGWFGVTASDFIADLAKVTGPIELSLNSPGGDVFEGVAIYNALQARPDKVTVTVQGIAASIASVIAMGGDEIRVSNGAQLMIHDAFSMQIGNAADMRKLADLLDRQSDNIAGIYALKTGKPADHWRGLMQAETWFTAEEAVSAGLADSVAPGKSPAPRASWDLSVFAKSPAAGQPAPVLDAADTSEWDGPKAMANGAASDDPAAFYAGICAGKKAGNPHNQSSWALPYKFHPGDAPNAAGTRNALARLPQTEGLTNEAEARATLQRAMKQVDPDYEPGSSSDAADQIDPQLLRSVLLAQFSALEGVEK